MRRDGRKLDHKTLEEIRRMAVERVWEGEDPSEVIASYGFCRTTIYKWLRTAKGKRRGLDVLRSRKGTGRPPKLTKSQQRQVFRRQRPTSIWVRFWSVDAAGGFRIGC